MIERFLRFVNGSLLVCACGSNISRFLNLCARHEIMFWKIQPDSPTQVSFYIRLQDLYELRPYLRKTKTRIHIRKRIGFPFFWQKYRARKLGIFVLLCVMAGVWVLSTRIWRIEIKGNSSLGEDAILEYLSAHNVTYGMPAKEIDNDALELSLRQDLEPVIWASVYETGTRLVVQIQEKISSHEETKEAEGTCMDLAASADATIASVITRSGLAKVKNGDKVKKGDVLVCGRQEILDDNGEVREYYYKSADADVYGYTMHPYEDWISSKMTEKKETGNKHKRYFLQVLNWRLVTPALHAEYASERSVTDTRQFCLQDSFYLPVYFGEITTSELQEKTVMLTKEQVKQLALTHFSQFLSELEENGVRIVDKNVMIEQIDKNYHIYGQVKGCEKITTLVPTERKREEPVNESE
mgnify:FL=1